MPGGSVALARCLSALSWEPWPCWKLWIGLCAGGLAPPGFPDCSGWRLCCAWQNSLSVSVPCCKGCCTGWTCQTLALHSPSHPGGAGVVACSACSGCPALADGQLHLLMPAAAAEDMMDCCGCLSVCPGTPRAWQVWLLQTSIWSGVQCLAVGQGQCGRETALLCCSGRAVRYHTFQPAAAGPAAECVLMGCQPIPNPVNAGAPTLMVDQSEGGVMSQILSANTAPFL